MQSLQASELAGCEVAGVAVSDKRERERESRMPSSVGTGAMFRNSWPGKANSV